MAKPDEYSGFNISIELGRRKFDRSDDDNGSLYLSRKEVLKISNELKEKGLKHRIIGLVNTNSSLERINLSREEIQKMKERRCRNERTYYLPNDNSSINL